MALTKNIPAVETSQIVEKYGTERHNLMDIVRDVQRQSGCVSSDAINAIASSMGIHRIEVEGVISFYHFLTRKPKGRTTIYLSQGAIPSMIGVHEVAKAFEDEVGLGFGDADEGNPIGLEWTSCIGMNDQEPAALIDEIVFTNLTPDKAREIVTHIKSGAAVKDLVKNPGDGKNSTDLINAMVSNHIMKTGDVIFADRNTGDAVRKLVTMDPGDVMAEVKNSNLRGRGGAGFPCGLKWDFCLKNESDTRYIVCNADEGEPGTFKDRVILTERPELVFEGMTVAAYVLKAGEGILYLRGEYEYLRAYLENVLNELRNANLLGNNIAGKEGFNFDIKIQMGAGAYVCGEETALIESAEGKRGEPRDRPPFPVSYGYMTEPTSVNNVETLSCAAKIIENGADWFKSIGTEKSSGTKVLSISGDCKNPGIYELPFGITIEEFLKEVGGENALAVQVGGPSGKCIGRTDFNRAIAFEDLATGGSMIVIGPDRDLLQIASDFMKFFIEESCGRCTPCRVGNKLLLDRLEKVRAGRGTKSDLEYMKSLGNTISIMSRCGLGLTSPNPVLSTLENFPEIYNELLSDEEFIPVHDMEKALEIGRLAADFK